MKIEEYKFGCMVVDGKTFTRDLIICRDKIIENWWRKEGHKLAVADIEDVLQKQEPEILIVGKGKFGLMKVLPETKEFLNTLGIQLIAMNTSEAVKEYNQLSDEKNVVGAFHLTC